jgi:hypothetical protein
MKLNDYKNSATVRLLVYGGPKTGKTSLAGRLADTKKLWWFDLESGISSLLKGGYNIGNIEYFKLPDSQGYPIAVETLLKVIKGGEQKICHAHGKVNCPQCKTPELFSVINVDKFGTDDVLVIDSVSQLSQSIMNYILKDRLVKDQEAKPTFDDWSRSGLLLDRIFSILQNANFNVACISHESMVEMEDGRKKMVPIAGSSNVSKVFAKFFDEVVYTEIMNKRFKAYSSAETCSVNAVVGSRSGLILDDKTTISKLFT